MDAQQLVAAMPYAERLGMTVTRADPEHVEATLAWSPDLCTTAELVHGGALMTLADSLGAICAFLNLPERATTSTIESKTNFLRGVREGELTAVASPLHVGRRTIVIQTEVRDGRGKLVTLTTQTQAVIT